MKHLLGGSLIWGPTVRNPPSPSPFLKGGIDLTKNPKKEGMEKLLKGRGILRSRGFYRKEVNAVSLGIFSTWGVANVTT